MPFDRVISPLSLNLACRGGQEGLAWTPTQRGWKREAEWGWDPTM